jgi:hypothetical protein
MRENCSYGSVGERGGNNPLYPERFKRLRIDKNIFIWGISRDSTIIDARGVPCPWGSGLDSAITILVNAEFNFRNFHVIGTGKYKLSGVVFANFYSPGIDIRDCILENGLSGISFYNGYNIAENLIIKNVGGGIYLGTYLNSSVYEIRNCLIITEDGGITQSGAGRTSIFNNILIYKSNQGGYSGIRLTERSRTEIRNNLIAGYYNNINDQYGTDSCLIINNVLGYSMSTGIYLGNTTKNLIKNNIFLNERLGIKSSSTGVAYPDYNLYWGLKAGKYFGSTVYPGPNEIEADPMVMKDSLPLTSLKLDMHLQKYSPAIDAGDPDILDIDGSRSDIGMYGGPYGEKYSYQDLAPSSPSGLTVTADSGSVYLKWKKNTEADFMRYIIYSDTTAGFIPDPGNILTETTDTFYVHSIPYIPVRIYYRIASADSQGNISQPTEELGVVLSSIDDDKPEIIQEYELYQNYPNPFNPETKIPYRLKEGGYVRISVYDITGQLVTSLVNGYRDSGYHEETLRINNNTDKPFGTEVKPTESLL